MNATGLVERHDEEARYLEPRLLGQLCHRFEPHQSRGTLKPTLRQRRGPEPVTEYEFVSLTMLSRNGEQSLG